MAAGSTGNARGEWPADNFLIRGTRTFNEGVLLQIYDGCRRGYRGDRPSRTA